MNVAVDAAREDVTALCVERRRMWKQGGQVLSEQDYLTPTYGDILVGDNV